MVSHNKPAMKLNTKTGNVDFFTWKKQFTSWAVTNRCADRPERDSNPIYLQGPNKQSEEELINLHGGNEVDATRRAYYVIT